MAASLVGTAVEFYDFYIYATAAALVFGPLFFPSSSPSAQLLAAYASFAHRLRRASGRRARVRALRRPHRTEVDPRRVAARDGRVDLAIAFLPTYATAGWLAPLLLCLLRFGQGFGLGGEWGGAALLAVENAPPGFAARFGMFPQLGAPVGFVAANGFFLLLGLGLTPERFQAWGWRLPFLASALLIALGLWVRLTLTETPMFRASLAHAPPPRVPILEVLRDHGRALVAGSLAVVACYAIFYLTTAFALGYGTTTLGYTRTAFLAMQLIAIVFLAVGIVASAVWADRASARRVLMAGCAATVAIGFLLAPMLGAGSAALVLAFLSAALFVMGFVYGPLGAWLPELFPVRVRYSGASLAFNLGGILGGALAPFIATALAARGGLALVGLYLSGAALVSLVGLVAIAPSARGRG